MSIKNITVLAGGNSPERDVSLSSGRAVANALRKNGYAVALCDPFCKMEVQELHFSSTEETAPFLQNGTPKETIDLALFAQLCASDAVFLALHGGQGEDGTIQSLLQLCGIAYTGPNPLACRLAMDKSVTQEMLTAAKIPTPFGVLLTEKTELDPAPVCFPCVLKPRTGGSSIGLYHAKNRAECEFALQDWAQNGDGTPLLCQPYIAGREFSVAVLGGKALPVAEIFADGAYDYRQKYDPDGAREVCPADLLPHEKQELQDLAVRAARALRMDAVCRVDFLQSAQNGQFYCLEVNALPGMTERSLLPLCAKAVGIDFPSLCERILQDGLARGRQ